ncbi:MAG TPA: universal stress protein [Gaiellaceae bacterium]|nr:universal stress protein [Gaiellaceae bacterium]
MAATIIVSYDGTENDTDALALGRLFAGAGGSLALAYVRHSVEVESGRERLAQHEAQELLETGVRWLGEPDVPRHVVLSASTPEGLRELAEREGADVIVFGSEYRTTPGHVAPGTSAQRLLEGGPLAVALAPAGFREHAGAGVEKVAAVSEEGDPGTQETAESIAAALGATVVSRANGDTGLVVVGSKQGTAAGRVTLSAAAQYLIEVLRCPVLVLPHGVALRFGP